MSSISKSQITVSSSGGGSNVNFKREYRISLAYCESNNPGLNNSFLEALAKYSLLRISSRDWGKVGIEILVVSLITEFRAERYAKD